MNKHPLEVVFTGLTILMVTLWLFVQAKPGYAQTPEPTLSPAVTITATPALTVTPASSLAVTTTLPFSQTQPGLTELKFTQFGQSTLELRSPVDQQAFTFELPYRWQVKAGESYIELYYDLRADTLDSTSLITNTANAILEIYFDNALVSSFSPPVGLNQVIRLPLPAEAFTTPNQPSHEIRFVYYAGDCDNQRDHSILIIKPTSFFHFKYDLLPLQPDLADFPRPLAQNVFALDPILIVIPDNYSENDLAAAASVAATLGLRMFGNATLDIVTASQATPIRLANTSAVIIGQPRSNALLLDLYQRNRLPTSLQADKTTLTGPADQPIMPDDGVIQEIMSEVSNDHVYLIVTGSSDVAVTRAAQALSILSPRYGFNGNLVVIADFEATVAATGPLSDTFTLAELGLNNTTFYGLETQRNSVRFTVPANWRLAKDPTLTLLYVPSAKLLNTSGMTVRLNNQPVGSVPIDNTILGERQAVIHLPIEDFKPGVNRLTFEATLNIDVPECELPELDQAWIRISGASQLRLPHQTDGSNLIISLNDALVNFASRPDLSDVWFSLAESPTPAELTGMIRVASWLGPISGGPGFMPRVSRGVITDTAQLDEYHLIAFGLPTSNPVIASLNEELPQPFVPGENNLRQEVGNVVYRLPSNFSVGLLEILNAPWNASKRAVLISTATTQEAVEWAIKALTNEVSYYNLDGNVAFIQQERVETFDTSEFVRSPAMTAAEKIEGAAVALEVVTPTVIAAAPTEVAANLPTPAAASQPVPAAAPPFPIELIVGLIGSGVAIAAIGTFLSWRKKAR